MYPPDKMEEVIKKISSFPDVVIYLFGGTNEAGILDKWEKNFGNAVSVAVLMESFP